MVEASVLPSHGTDHGKHLYSVLLQYSKKGAQTHLKFRLDVAKALMEAAHPVPALV